MELRCGFHTFDVFPPDKNKIQTEPNTDNEMEHLENSRQVVILRALEVSVLGTNNLMLVNLHSPFKCNF